MKKLLLLMLPVSCLLNGCGNNADRLNDQLTAARDSIVEMTTVIDSLKVQNELLGFPADQRLASIENLITAQKYAQARKEIATLKNVFPKSQEALSCDTLLSQIETAEAALQAEQERIKALGFKAIEPSLSATIGYNMVTFSNFSNSSKYIYDSCPDVMQEQSQTADRDTKFLLTTMTVTSTDSDPKLPIPAVYKIEGDKMTYIDAFQINFSRWKDFSNYIGNKGNGPENDFAKTSTISFKLGCQISDKILQAPYAVVLKKSNVLSRKNRYRPWPNMYYTGNAAYPSTLTVTDFSSEFQLLKISNL